MRFFLGFSLACCMLGTAHTAAAQCTASSADQRVSLLELYTSEGCSSCPPADRWLSNLKTAGYKPDRVIALAFHVDYWDYIGWKDRFARAEFTARQRQAAGKGLLGFVYTPQVMLNGRDFRRWQLPARFEQALNDSSAAAPRASIALQLAALPSGETSVTVKVHAHDADSRKHGDVYIAVNENGLKSTVNAGENSGRELAHDHVVREWMGPYKLQDAAKSQWEKLILLKAEWKERKAGVAAFVQHRSSGEVLQAVASELCE